MCETVRYVWAELVRAFGGGLGSIWDPDVRYMMVTIPVANGVTPN